MNNHDLDQILKKAGLPKPPQELLQELPGQITRALDQDDRRGRMNPSETAHRHPVWLWGLSTACVILGAFLVGFWRGQESALGPSQLSNAKRYLQESQSLFPNQVKAIVFDKNGPHLVLSEKPNVSNAVPVYLKVSTEQSAQTIITYNGQQILIHGEPIEVLLNGNNDVLLIGQNKVWTHTSRSGWGKTSIEAQPITL